jgi:hypothetical protein
MALITLEEQELDQKWDDALKDFPACSEVTYPRCMKAGTLLLEELKSKIKRGAPSGNPLENPLVIRVKCTREVRNWVSSELEKRGWSLQTFGGVHSGNEPEWTQVLEWHLLPLGQR